MWNIIKIYKKNKEKKRIYHQRKLLHKFFKYNSSKKKSFFPGNESKKDQKILKGNCINTKFSRGEILHCGLRQNSILVTPCNKRHVKYQNYRPQSETRSNVSRYLAIPPLPRGISRLLLRHKSACSLCFVHWRATRRVLASVWGPPCAFLHPSSINIQGRYNGYFVPRFYIP